MGLSARAREIASILSLCSFQRRFDLLRPVSHRKAFSEKMWDGSNRKFQKNVEPAERYDYSQPLFGSGLN